MPDEPLEHALFFQALYCEYSLQKGDHLQMFEQFECSLERIEHMWQSTIKDKTLDQYVSLYHNYLTVIKGFLVSNPNCLGIDDIEDILVDIINRCLGSNNFAPRYFSSTKLTETKESYNQSKVAEKEREILSLALSIVYRSCCHRDLETFLFHTRCVVREYMVNHLAQSHQALCLIVLFGEVLDILLEDAMKGDGGNEASTEDARIIDSTYLQQKIELLVNFNFGGEIEVTEEIVEDDNILMEDETFEMDEPSLSVLNVRFIDSLILLFGKENNPQVKVFAVQCLHKVAVMSEKHSFNLIPLLERLLLMEDNLPIRCMVLTCLWELVFVFPSLQHYDMLLSNHDFESNFIEPAEEKSASMLEFLTCISQMHPSTRQVSVLSILRLLRYQRVTDMGIEKTLLKFIQDEKNLSETSESFHLPIKKILDKYSIENDQIIKVGPLKTKREDKRSSGPNQK